MKIKYIFVGECTGNNFKKPLKLTRAPAMFSSISQQKEERFETLKQLLTLFSHQLPDFIVDFFDLL